MNSRFPWLLLALLCAAPAAAPALSADRPSAADAPAVAETPGDAAQRSDDSKFIRITRDDKGQPIALETAVVRYVPAEGEAKFTVDLISAVHVGEKSYYKQLNKLFDEYDVLLYELVAPQGTRIPKGGRAGDPVSGMMKSMLELDSQVERVDYTKKHFVHADLSPEQIGEKMRERGDTGLSLTLSVMSDMIRQANLREQKMRENPRLKAPEVGLFTLLFDPDASLKMKRMMAEEFDHMDELGGLGDTLTTLLIADRNEAAFAVLKDQITNGHRKIGIFYGGAHMPDFHDRLTKGLGLKRDSTQWLEAWDLE